METYLILGIGLIVVIIFLLHDNNWKGCILYVITIVFAFAFYYIAEHFKKPAYECREEVESPCDKFFRFSHSRYLCPSGGASYCVEKRNNKEPSSFDPCINCGRLFWKHSYDATSEEKGRTANSWDKYSEAIIETPAIKDINGNATNQTE